MNRDILVGNWKQVKGKFKTKWGELTDDELEQAQGKFESLVGLMQKRYGLARDKAEIAVDSFIEGVDEKDLRSSRSTGPASPAVRRT